jgi:hypothetical protein
MGTSRCNCDSCMDNHRDMLGDVCDGTLCMDSDPQNLIIVLAVSFLGRPFMSLQIAFLLFRLHTIRSLSPLVSVGMGTFFAGGWMLLLRHWGSCRRAVQKKTKGEVCAPATEPSMTRVRTYSWLQVYSILSSTISPSSHHISMTSDVPKQKCTSLVSTLVAGKNPTMSFSLPISNDQTIARLVKDGKQPCNFKLGGPLS